VTRTLLAGGRVRCPGRTDATAMLVDGERVAWVGASADADRADADQVVELGGAYVTAAFVDAHVHSTSTGLALTGLDLTGTPSLAAALAAVERFARDRRGLGILLGQGWDESTWPERRPPTRPHLPQPRSTKQNKAAAAQFHALHPKTRPSPAFAHSKSAHKVPPGRSRRDPQS